MMNLTIEFSKADDEEQKEALREAGTLVSLAMVRNIREIEEEERGSANLH